MSKAREEAKRLIVETKIVVLLNSMCDRLIVDLDKSLNDILAQKTAELETALATSSIKCRMLIEKYT